MRLAAALAGAALSSLPAAAREIPPPEAPLTEASIATWVDAHIDTAGWRLLAGDLASVTFGSDQGVSVGADGFLTSEIRREYYGAGRLGPNGTRSGRQTWIVDCKGRKVWVRRISIYAENNMRGAVRTRESPQPNWTEVSAGSVNARVMELICRAPSDGLTRPPQPQDPNAPS